MFINVSNARGMLEQVVNCFYEMRETNPDLVVDDVDFLGVWDINQKKVLMINF